MVFRKNELTSVALAVAGSGEFVQSYRCAVVVTYWALSSLNCNRFLGGENFAGSKVTKDFPRSVVEQSRYVRDAPRRDILKGRAFGKKLADEPIGVLVGPALPGSIGVGKEYRHFDAGLQKLILGELFTVVEGDAAPLLARERLEQLLHFEAHAASGSVLR